MQLPVTYNFRPVEGTRAGTLYRSDALTRVNDEGRDRLRELGVRRIIDLRSDLDRQLAGLDQVDGVGADELRVPILDGGRMSEIPDLTIEHIYRRILDDHQPEIASVISAVADVPDGAVVIHCTAGKDRTGVTSALIQLAIGVPADAVIDDYAVTGQYLAGEWADAMLESMRQFGVELTPQLREFLVESPARALNDALDHLETRYGGVHGYFAAIGVGESVVERLRDRLVP